ncbi:MAG TPA: ABC transporter [Nitrospinae bacterium]|nr:ABC transporter [Nitrospinota bacterium]HBA26203.1 ABC transporter [Nitrospinota bacterium]
MINIKNLTKHYGNLTAVSALSLNIPAGECFGFLGPNGAGKTTTIKLLAGLLKPNEGTIEIGGYDVQRDPQKVKGIIGYIPDKPFIYEKLTGGEFLDFIAELYQVNEDFVKEKREELLNLFAIKDFENELVESYSHGMRQKLVITAALIHNPKVIIVDEPMVGLDPKGMRQVKEMFKQLTKSGVTIFMSTHTMSVAQEMCHRIGIINKGKLIALGNMNNLQKQAQVSSGLEDVFLQLTSSETYDLS